MIGIVEVITLLLGMAGFGLQPSPSPATPEQALQYAIADAELVVHFDFASTVPNNYKTFVALQHHPQVKSSPELIQVVRKLVTEVEGARGIAKTTTGIDPVTDVAVATVFAQFVPNQDPVFVAAVRGKLPASAIDKIAKLANKPAVKLGGGTMIEMGGKQPAVGMTSDGVLIAGTPRLVRERLDGWKAPVRTPNTTLAHAHDALAQKPVFAAVVNLSPVTRREVAAKLGADVKLVTDLVARHRVFAFAVLHDGLGWTWIDRDKAGLEQVALMSEGAIDLLRASHFVPRGIAKVVLGAVESYRGTDKRLDEIIKRRPEILKIVDGYTGDGNFKVQVDKDPKIFRLAVRATGKTVSEVVPGGFLGGAAAIGAFLLIGGSKAPAPPHP